MGDQLQENDQSEEGEQEDEHQGEEGKLHFNATAEKQAAGESKSVACCASTSAYSTGAPGCIYDPVAKKSHGSCNMGWCMACYVPGGDCTQGTQNHCWDS